MKEAISLICLVGFALLPVLVLGLRMVFPGRIPWWSVVLIAVGGGWGLAVVSAMLNDGPDTGAGHVGALFFGWALALLWFLPWWLMYGVVHLFRRRKGRPPGHDRGPQEKTGDR
ncbi:MAG: hypothetical protein ACO3I0_04110 [Limisphaerales bacterium]|jgi:hypothetical protein